MKLYRLLLSFLLIVLMQPLSNVHASPGARQIDEEDLKILMPDVIRYFDITAYGGIDRDVELPDVYTKEALLELGKGDRAWGYSRTALDPEKKTWQKALEDYFPDSTDIEPTALCSFFNQLDIDGKYEDLCLLARKLKPPGLGACPPLIHFDERNEINPLAYKYHWALALLVTDSCAVFPRSLSWMTSLFIIKLIDVTVSEIPEFIYELPNLEVLEIRSSYFISAPTKFHKGMEKLKKVVLKGFLPKKDILDLPALKELDAYGSYWVGEPKDEEAIEVIRELTRRGVKHRYTINEK